MPPDPDPPFGAGSSVRVFRASRKFYYLRLVRWSFAQAAALAGIIFWFGVIAASEHEVARVRRQPGGGSLATLQAGRNQVTLGPFRNVPPRMFQWIWLGKAAGVMVYAGQLVATLIVLRMDYRMRWYIITDRSLRIRFGVWNVQEITMSYANLQKVMISQGPLERLLGISNVQVASAGGGTTSDTHEGKSEAMHSGVFQGVENAGEIRNLIVDRLRSFRESGLGDPDEKVPVRAIAADNAKGSEAAISAARELLHEARTLTPQSRQTEAFGRARQAAYLRSLSKRASISPSSVCFPASMTGLSAKAARALVVSGPMDANLSCGKSPATLGRLKRV